MEIKPIFLSLKQNKFMAILMIIQIAFTMGVLSSSVLVATETLQEWGKPSGIPHEDIVRITPEFFDENIDVGQALVRDIERVKNMPNVINVAPSNAVPFTAENMINVYLSNEEDAQEYKTVVFQSDENIFDVLQLSLIEGKQFTASDIIKGAEGTTPENASQVMISQDMATALFADKSPLGQTIWLAKNADPVQVVGIYSNFMTGERLNGRGKSYQSIIRPQVKWSQSRQPNYLIRVEPGKGTAMMEDIINVFYQERGRYINSSELLKRTQKRMYDGRGSRALTMLVISVVLLIITGLGMTGLTAFQVTQKRKQIGTRRALGAKKRDVMRYFLTENSIITFIGLLIGILVTLSITFELSEQASQNFMNVSVLLLTGLVMWVVNILAVWFPAKRAANIEPAIVTRSA
ncbi:MAG: ABC transporter permease [Colwelliaceae bacterium]|nr:ABC transporter permease [Colwelliaceae bacterium]